MFVFDNVSDKDARSYGYELYEADQVSGSYPNIVPVTNATIYSSGTSGANVFTVAVENSTDSTTRRYYGRIRTIDSTGNPSDWSPIVQSDQENPLISNQYIASITAAKITAGTIGAHEIILTQAGSATSYSAPANTAVIRSSNYQANTAGWLIRGDGFAEFDSTVIRGGLKAGSVFINADNRWKSDINGNVIANAEFKLGTSTKYLSYDGVDTLTFTGNLLAANGTFSGNLSAAGGTFTGNVSIGSGSSILKADTNGLYLGNTTFASAPFRVTPQGAVTANNISITGGTLNINNVFTVQSNGFTQFTSGKVGGLEIYTDGTLQTTFGQGVSYFGWLNVIGSNKSGMVSIGEIGGDQIYGYVAYDAIGVGLLGSGTHVTKYGIVYDGYSARPGPFGHTIAFDWDGSELLYMVDNAYYNYLTYGGYSDRRIKRNIDEPQSNWVDKILNQVKIWEFNMLNPYTRDEESMSQEREIGVIADEFKELFPKLETSHKLKDPDGKDKDQLRSVNYEGLVPALILTVQKLNEKIESLEARLSALE